LSWLCSLRIRSRNSSMCGVVPVRRPIADVWLRLIRIGEGPCTSPNFLFNRRSTTGDRRRPGTLDGTRREDMLLQRSLATARWPQSSRSPSEVRPPYIGFFASPSGPHKSLDAAANANLGRCTMKSMLVFLPRRCCCFQLTHVF